MFFIFEFFKTLSRILYGEKNANIFCLLCAHPMGVGNIYSISYGRVIFYFGLPAEETPFSVQRREVSLGCFISGLHVEILHHLV